MEAGVLDEGLAEEEEGGVGGPFREVNEDAVEGFSEGVILGDEVDVVDIGEADFAEDGTDARFADVGEDAGDAKGRLMGSESAGVGHDLWRIGKGRKGIQFLGRGGARRGESVY